MINFCILGNPRSGTTLLRLMLSAHSKVIVPPEAGFAVWLYESWQGEFTCSLYVEKLLQTKKIESWNINKKELLAFLNNNNVNDLKEAILYTYKYYGSLAGAEVIGDKNNFYLNHVNTLKVINPNMSYIHIIRDGRDVACSYLELMKKNYTSEYAPKLTTKISEIANEWKLNNQLISNNLKGLNSITVRLEDLIENPSKELAKICGLLELEYEEVMLKYYSQAENFEPVEYDQWKEKNKKPLSNDNYKYKRKLTAEQITEFNQIAKKVIHKYGYEL